MRIPKGHFTLECFEWKKLYHAVEYLRGNSRRLHIVGFSIGWCGIFLVRGEKVLDGDRDQRN